MQTISIIAPKNSVEEGKWLLAITSFEATDSVFNITNENNSFSISAPSHWNSEDGEELINKLNKLLELRSENGSELHVEEVAKRGTRIEIENGGYNLASFDQYKSEILAELKKVIYRDLEDTVYRLQLTYNEIIGIMDVKFIAGSTSGYTIPTGVYKIRDTNLMLKSLFHKQMKVKFTVDDIRLKSKLTINKTIGLQKIFFTLLGFTESHSGVLRDIPSFVRLIPESYKSDKPINITGMYRIHLNCDCIQGSMVNGVRETIFNSLALSSPTGHKVFKEFRIELFKKKKNSVLSHITFYLEDDDHKPIDFNGERINFIGQLI